MSVRKIAKEAGVSIATVSRALNNESGISAKTREMVLEIANGVRYTPAIGKRATNNIGFVSTGKHRLSHPFDAALLAGVTRGRVKGIPHNIVLLNVESDKTHDETYTQYFMRNGVNSVILRVNAESRELCRAIAAERFPHVVVAERFDSPDINWVHCDSKPDSMRAVEYLIGLGHRRIAFAANHVPDRDHTDRMEGYQAALAKHDIAFDPELIYLHPANMAGGATVLKMAMNTAHRPTALYCADWKLAIGALKAAHKSGLRIPEEMSIVGFDDTNVRHEYFPTLTAICQESAQLGVEAVSILSRLASGSSDQRLQVTLPTYFEINETTAPPPAGADSDVSN